MPQQKRDAAPGAPFFNVFQIFKPLKSVFSRKRIIKGKGFAFMSVECAVTVKCGQETVKHHGPV